MLSPSLFYSHILACVCVRVSVGVSVMCEQMWIFPPDKRYQASLIERASSTILRKQIMRELNNRGMVGGWCGDIEGI